MTLYNRFSILFFVHSEDLSFSSHLSTHTILRLTFNKIIESKGSGMFHVLIFTWTLFLFSGPFRKFSDSKGWESIISSIETRLSNRISSPIVLKKFLCYRHLNNFTIRLFISIRYLDP